MCLALQGQLQKCCPFVLFILIGKATISNFSDLNEETPILFFGIATSMSLAHKIDSAHHSYCRRVILRSTFEEIILYTDIEEGSINGLVFLLFFRRHYDVRS